MMTFSETSLVKESLFANMDEFAELVFDKWEYDYPYRLWRIVNDMDAILSFDEYQRSILQSIINDAQTLDAWCLGYRGYSNEPVFVDIPTFKKMYEDWRLNAAD